MTRPTIELTNRKIPSEGSDENTKKKDREGSRALREPIQPFFKSFTNQLNDGFVGKLHFKKCKNITSDL